MKRKTAASTEARHLRRRAEQRLRGQQPAEGAAQVDADARRLVHELRVHQIELEMQNAEIRKARDELELTLEKYTDLYDFAPVGYFSLASTSEIRLANLTGARLLGMERSRLLGRRLGQHVAADLQPVFQDFLQRVFAGEARQSCEVIIVSAGRPPRTMRIEAERSRDRPECRAVVMDITERKQAEEVLRRNEALFSALIEQAPVGVYVVDDQLRLQQVNPRARPVFKKIHPLVGREIAEILRILWPAGTANEIIGHFRHTLKTGDSYYASDFSQRRHDTGERESYEWQLQRITLPAGQHGVVCFFSNTTERKRAEEAQRKVVALAAANEEAHKDISRRRVVEATLRETEKTQRKLLTESQELHTQLRHLTRQILVTQEEERKKISRELHDEIAQILAGINVQLSALKVGTAINPESLHQRIGQTQSLVAKSVEAVHRFARRLRPTLLDDLGLIPALRSYIKDLPGRNGLRIRFTALAEVEALDNTRRTVLYRVAQEALTNVIRHARARCVIVRIGTTADAVRMDVHDDGRSFPVERVLSSNPKRRLGLLGMWERVEMVGGKFSIESAPGKGTTVCAEVPFPSGKRRTKA